MDESPETSRPVHPNSLDIEKLFLEAQHRWLSPAEICEILRNYKKLKIASEPSNKPPSGSLFLFDRKETRKFRKDGHNWQRKNGKLAKEGHKKLKAGSIDVLHCYYALGEENKNFQRRCYSMLEKDFSHIFLFHYLEITVAEKNRRNSKIDCSSSSGSRPNNCLGPSENTDRYLDSAQPLQRENAQPAIPGTDLAPTQSDKGKSDNHAEATVYSLASALASIVVELFKDDSDQSFSFFPPPNTVEELLSVHFDKVLDLQQSQIPAESKEALKKQREEDEGPDDEGPDGEGQDDEGPEKDEEPGKEKEEGKKRAPDSALESGKAPKILKAYLASMALLTAYYNVQSTVTIQMLVLVFVEASKNTGERKLSYIDDGFELSAIRQ